MLTVDADRKTVDLEAEGVVQAGLHLSNLIRVEEGEGVVEGSMHVTGALARLGWKLTLYAEGDRLLSIGSGVSRLTGRISVNPLKLRKILKTLR